MDLLQALTLLDSVIHFEESNDAYFTQQEIMDQYAKHTVALPRTVVERGLYCANMLDEKEAFWHPKGLTFKKFLGKVFYNIDDIQFNQDYNWIEELENVNKTRR